MRRRGRKDTREPSHAVPAAVNTSPPASHPWINMTVLRKNLKFEEEVLCRSVWSPCKASLTHDAVGPFLPVRMHQIKVYISTAMHKP
ncbi:hypothetical protein CgunFtcFv8_000122 [Champsocephalus gunnari]|uniref:Uncharacterized protein n=1 Tax=Champsocephalus gunnari TaxID=52237 RepID=A0AAN8HPJ1_CHAGU|nr:hypothetical protein CgunFtcFv8_000122 [Champsocephalus gunnari]